MDNNQNKKNKTEIFSNIWNKASDIGKKAADGIQKGAKTLSEESKKNAYERKVRKYNPLFKEDFESSNFKLPNVIEIVDDAVRRDIDVCEGAIGWTDKVNDVEILHLYDEWIAESKINFIPFAKCDAVYCVDAFDRSRFINSESIFERMTNEKLAELENIAFCLGAKSCAIEIVEASAQQKSSNLKIGLKYSGAGGNAEQGSSSGYKNKQSGKNISYFDGNSIPKRPSLKWFAFDDNIKGLIEMRCSGDNSIKSKVLELNCSSAATMSQKTACAVDKILKIKASISMESKSIEEHNRKLIFEIEF